MGISIQQFSQMNTGYDNKVAIKGNEAPEMATTQLTWRDRVVILLQNIPLIKSLIAPREEDIATQAVFLKAIAEKYGNSVAWGVTNQYKAFFTKWGNTGENQRSIQPLRSYKITEIIQFAESLSSRYPLVNASTIKSVAREYERESKKLKAAISKQEYIAIKMYTGPFYSMINGALRGNDPVKLAPWQALISDATEGLKKLAENGYQNKGLLVRGMTIPKNNQNFRIDQYEEGKTVVDKGFLSTSSDKRVAQNFLTFQQTSRSDDKVLLYLFANKTGARIDSLSMYRAEKEVLIQPSTAFHVLFRAFDGKSNVYKAVLAPKESSATDGTQGYVDSLNLAAKSKKSSDKEVNSNPENRLQWLDLA